MPLISLNPATGQVLSEYPTLTAQEVSAAVGTSQDVFESWARCSPGERARPLATLARVLRERSGELATQMTREMGKPIAQARSEVEKCAFGCEYYAAEGPGLLASIPLASDASKSLVSFEPLGIVLAIMPWNFPLWQAVRFAAPALVAGNTVLLKHAPTVPGCALAIQRAFEEAGFPQGALQTLLVDVEPVAGLIADPRVAAVTFTGSTRAGRAVAAQAGAHIKKTVLELGGSDPYVVLEDADLDLAVQQCVEGRLQNTGQSCIAAKRWIVVEAVIDLFRERALALMAEAEMGDPMLETTRIGPLARQDLRDTLHDQVRRSVEAGATCLLGGRVPDRPGWFYPATMLDDVTPGMAAFDEELFGPVAALVQARDEEHAIELANQTRYGLAAAVFTRDTERGERIARERLHAGGCFVNAFARSDPRLPFGGVKDSGFGRELSGFGIREFTNVKTVWVA